jgi:hypothetical protein
MLSMSARIFCGAFLSRRGHEKRAVMHGIDKATKYVDDNLKCRQTKMMARKEVRTLFLHWKYH